MNRRRVELEVEEIFIDDRKAAYIAERKIDRFHVAQVLENEPHYYVRVSARTGREEYAMLGQTSSGRFLLVAIEAIQIPDWRLISAYWMRERDARRMYESEVAE